MDIEKFPLRDFNIDNSFEKKGGEALVSKAWHHRLGEVAIKRWTHDTYNSYNEMKLLIQNSNHPNIIQFVGILINDESTNIGYIMPYMPMGSLHDRKSHDDIKLSDLGMARLVEKKINTLTKGFDEYKMTTIKIFGLGTSFYMAPEMLKGEEYDISVDAYSLSITIWEILHRRCWHTDSSKRPTIDYILQFYCNRESKVSGGYDENKKLDTLLILENNGQNWKELNIKLPYPIEDHGAQFLNSNLYIFGGQNSNSTYKLSKSLQWEKMADMNQKRHEISNSSVILNNQIWVCGGRNEDVLKSVEMYDPETNTWKYMKPMNECRSLAAATVVNEKIFCSGWHNSVECYDPFSDIWTFISNMPRVIWGHGAVEINRNFTVMGGYNGKECLSSVWALDTTDKDSKWIEKSSMSILRSAFSIAKIGDKIFVCGQNNKNVEIFDGEVWRDGPKMPTPRLWATAVVIPTEFARDLEKFIAVPMEEEPIKQESSGCSIQ